MTAPFSLEITDELLSTTRAVRRRLDLERPVEREVLLDCIRISQQAPTGGNQQGWHWVIVTDAAKRQELAELYRRLGSQYLAQARAAVSEDDPQTARVYDSALWLADHLAEVPVHVIPCTQGRLASEGFSNAAAASFYGSIIPAVWSFQIALRSRGLGSAYTTLHLFAEQDAAKLLGIPDDVSQIALLPVAYTKGTDFKHAARPDPETITSWNAWGQH
jgi:nitroreductase